MSLNSLAITCFCKHEMVQHPIGELDDTLFVLAASGSFNASVNIRIRVFEATQVSPNSQLSASRNVFNFTL
jgi:hypothetical protein